MNSLGCIISKNKKSSIAHQNCKKALYCQKDNKCKTVMHAIIFTPKWLAIQVSIPKGTSINTRFTEKEFLENLSNSTRNVDRRQASVVFICYLFCLFCCFTSQVNSYGHCGTVSSHNHTFSWASLNKQLTSTSCTVI